MGLIGKKGVLKLNLILLIFFSYTTSLYGHGSKDEHAIEMLQVLGLSPIKGSPVYKWACFISSDMIDKAHQSEFYKKLQSEHFRFACKHRLLFHWAYDGIPWNKDFEERIIKYCYDYDLNLESNLRVFKAKLKSEQRRRNQIISRETQRVFGFSVGGFDRTITTSFAGIVYNVHLIGDYMTDNTDLEGLQSLSSILRNTLQKILNLDKKEGIFIAKTLRKFIATSERYESASNEKGIQVLADNVMSYLKGNIPHFIKKARGGSIYRRLKKRNVKFIND